MAGQGAGKCCLYLPALTARTHGVTLRFKDKRTLTLLTWQHIITLRTSSLPDGERDLMMGNLICRHRLVLNVKFDCLKIESCVVLITRIVADFNHIWSQIVVLSYAI